MAELASRCIANNMCPVMNEKEFWEIIHILLNQIDNNIGWCDWIEPKKYILGKDPFIEGNICFLSEIGQKTKKFTLHINNEANSLADIDWDNTYQHIQEKSSLIGSKSSNLIFSDKMTKQMH